MGQWQTRWQSRTADNERHRAWLDRHHEDIIAPELEIIDPHHHIFDHESRYLWDELLDDLDSGHNVRASVFLQCRAMYRSDGPEELRPLGETEFVNGVAAVSASGLYGPLRACAGIVGFADLRLGARVQDVLEAHLRIAGKRFRGVRYSSGFAPDETVKTFIRAPVPEGLLRDKQFSDGFARLAPLGLSFDAWLYFPQLSDVGDLARRFETTDIVLNHVGGLLGVGRYAGRRDEVFAQWRQGMAGLARHPNVTVKLGGLGMKTVGFGFNERAAPPSSIELAQAWRPYIETCIELFGVERCMFESNFPVDKITCSYPVLWNAFKRMAANYSDAERAALFRTTAARVYRL